MAGANVHAEDRAQAPWGIGEGIKCCCELAAELPEAEVVEAAGPFAEFPWMKAPRRVKRSAECQ